MNLNKEQFSNAIEIISEHHTSIVAINLPKNNHVGNLGQSEWNIFIKRCVPAVINRLIEEGFHLSMTEQGLEVFYL